MSYKCFIAVPKKLKQALLDEKKAFKFEQKFLKTICSEDICLNALPKKNSKDYS